MTSREFGTMAQLLKVLVIQPGGVSGVAFVTLQLRYLSLQLGYAGVFGGESISQLHDLHVGAA